MSEPAIECGPVLVIADQPHEREQVRAWLEPVGYRVATSEGGAAALGAFARTPAELVLLDAASELPGALALCRQLRQLPAAERVAIVLVVSSTDAAAQREAAECGVDDCIVKPLQRSELLLRLRALVRLRRAARQPQQPDLALARLQRDALVHPQRQREETIALLVHDMRNPLAGVLSNADFLASSSGLDAEQSECALDILHASRRLHRMVVSLLDVSRSEFGALRPLLGPVELHALLHDARAFWAARLRDKSLTLNLRLPDEPVRLHADGDMLLRLLANLVESAARAAPAGSQIALEARVGEGLVELRVSDTGDSVSAAERARLFDSYVQVSQPEKRSRGRSSLGLSSCRVLVEAHGGRIWLDEQSSPGATICVSLPLA
jgi:two-component system, sensor histidine kinase and response regulator